jgi:N-acyl-L-homoserine lactone synthetase
VIVVVDQSNSHAHSHLLEQMFQLRARIFHDRLHWDVQVIDGKERDKYDDERPVYIIYADEQSGKAKGSLRLLPTTGPTLLAEFFADTLPDAVHLTAPTIWECTRFCLDEEILDPGNRQKMHSASAVLIAALGELAIDAGIESILGIFDARMIRLYKRIGCEVEILGCTERYGQPIYLGLFPVSRSILHTILDRLKPEQLLMPDRGKLPMQVGRLSA